MAQRTVAIGARSGLHARPATLFVRAAAAAPVPVRISVAGRPSVDARSMLGVLSLGAGSGVEVTLEASGEPAEETLDRLAAMLASDLDAEDAASSAAANAAADNAAGGLADNASVS